MNAVRPVPFSFSGFGRQRLAFVVGLLLLIQLAVQPALTASTQLYIVVQSAPALAAYSGGINGLAATSPEARGERQLKPDSAASRAYLDYLATQRADLLARAAVAVGHEVTAVDNYAFALNGFSARLTAVEANRVAALPGVALVAPNETLHTLTDAGPQWMNADDIWDGSAVSGPGNKGEGIVAGIIDTGVNPGHPSFAQIGPVDGYVHANPRTRFFGVCAAEPVANTQCNNKLIGLYDFVGGGAAGSGVVDDVGHGSHTASTVAGNVVDATLVAPTTTLAPRRISGVAPHANIISYKACQAAALPQLGACPINALLAAIDAATADVVDVINFSIGGGSVDPWQDPLGLSFFGAHAAGIFVAASAGNNGPNPQTIGRPSNSPWLLSVGASTHNRRPNGQVTVTKSNGTPLTIQGTSLTSGLGPLPVVDAKALGNELCDPFSSTQQAQIAGKIVICTQGVIGRVQKGINVQAGGGAGMILISQAGYKNSVVSDTHVIPTVMIGEWDGASLRQWLAGATSPLATLQGVDIQVDSGLADRMAGFSSRGPDLNLPNVIKPDVTAPGVSILAAWMNSTTRAGDDYEMIQGTSMSSPHAAGAGALLAAVHPNWTPDQIKAALMSTAFTVPAGGKESVPVTREDHTTPANPHDFGGGRIDVAAAARAGFTLDESAADYQAANPVLGGQAQTLNIASLANASCKPSCSWTRTLTSTAGSSVSYSVSVSDTAAFDLSVSPSSFTLPAGGTQTITITANGAGLAPSIWEYGVVRFIPSGGSVPTQHFPVAVSGAPVQLPSDCNIPATVVGSAASSPTVSPTNDVLQVTAAGLFPTYQGRAIPNIEFSLKVNELDVEGRLPPNHYWRVNFLPPGTPSGTTYYVILATDATGRQSFSYGTTVPGTFTTLGGPDNAWVDFATDTVHWTIAASKILNPQTGQVINGIVGQSGVAQPGTLTSGPLKSTSTGSYTLTGCSGDPTPTPSSSPTPAPDSRLKLYFQGNLDEGCTGTGVADFEACGGPFLLPDATLDANPPARWVVVSAVNDGLDQSLVDPNWMWDVSAPTTVRGPMTVEWWANCNGCVVPAIWSIELYADGEEVFVQEVEIPVPLVVPVRLTATVTLPELTASDRFVLQVDPQYLDIMEGTVILYDGTTGCGPSGGAPCDSLVRMPVAGADATPSPTSSPTPTASPSPTLPPTPSPTLAPTPPPTPTPLADLVVSAMSASEQKAKAGDRINISATIRNNGTAAAPATRTEFKFSDGTFLGAADTPAIPAGGSATVSVGWDTRGANGDYTITANADTTALSAESNEANNSANLHLTVRGNKVQNQSYEQPDSSGNGQPESWQGQSTGAGSTSYNEGTSTNSSDGTDSVSASGNGRSALIYGAPTWTSAPFAVNPGELLTISVDVNSVGLSSAPSLSLAYLGPAGELLSTVKVLSAPLTSNGFNTLSSELRVPSTVASVRLVLAGFAPTDTRTAGTVTFDNVAVWGE